MHPSADGGGNTRSSNFFFLNLAVKQRGFLIGTNFGADARLDTVNVCMSSVVNVRSCPHVRLDGGKCDMV